MQKNAKKPIIFYQNFFPAQKKSIINHFVGLSVSFKFDLL
jgi:hypothetical protein